MPKQKRQHKPKSKTGSRTKARPRTRTTPFKNLKSKGKKSRGRSKGKKTNSLQSVNTSLNTSLMKMDSLMKTPPTVDNFNLVINKLKQKNATNRMGYSMYSNSTMPETKIKYFYNDKVIESTIPNNIMFNILNSISNISKPAKKCVKIPINTMRPRNIPQISMRPMGMRPMGMRPVAMPQMSMRPMSKPKTISIGNLLKQQVNVPLVSKGKTSAKKGKASTKKKKGKAPTKGKAPRKGQAPRKGKTPRKGKVSKKITKK